MGIHYIGYAEKSFINSNKIIGTVEILTVPIFYDYSSNTFTDSAIISLNTCV